MAKGGVCPVCGGENTFYRRKAIYQCKKCKVIGWKGSPYNPGKGNREICTFCKERRAKIIHSENGLTIFHCYNRKCLLTYIRQNASSLP